MGRSDKKATVKVDRKVVTAFLMKLSGLWDKHAVTAKFLKTKVHRKAFSHAMSMLAAESFKLTEEQGLDIIFVVNYLIRTKSVKRELDTLSWLPSGMLEVKIKDSDKVLRFSGSQKAKDSRAM